MLKLITICLGTAFLMYLSGLYYPTQVQHTGHISRSSQKPGTDIFMAIAIFWLTCFMFLRTKYNDTAAYIDYWRTAPSVSEFWKQGLLWDLTGNPLSDFWQALSHELFPSSYHIYFMLPAAMICISVIKLFRHYSVAPWFSLLLYFSIGTFVMYMAALKQCLSVFFLMISIPYAEKEEYAKFYLLLAIGMLFHTHAFLFAILPFLFRKPWGKTTWIGIVVMLFMMATYDNTLGAFMEFAQSIGAMVAEVEVFDGHAINPLRVAVYWVPPLFALIFRERLFSNSSRAENLFVNMSVVAACILTIGLIQAANLFARMAANFEFAAALALPWMINKVFNKRSSHLVMVIAGLLYFSYFYYEFGIAKDFGSGYSSVTLWQFVLELLGK